MFYKQKNKIIIRAFALVMTIALLSFLQGCFAALKEDKEAKVTVIESAESAQNGHEDKSQPQEHIIEDLSSLDISFDIFQKNTYGQYFEKGNPVYFSITGLDNKLNNQENDSSKKKYRWEIGKDEILYGEKISYIFEDAQEYEVSLIVYNESFSKTEKAKIEILDINKPVDILKQYNCSVSAEYILKNNGPGNIKDAALYIALPQTDRPFQQVLNIYLKNNNLEEIFDNNWNLISKLHLGNLDEGEEISVMLTNDVIINEFEFISSNVSSFENDVNEKDIELYTGSEPFIEANNAFIKDIVKNVSGGETDPKIIAEKLYDFVRANIEYDYEKLDSGYFEYRTAIDILNAKKGICTDYSILYTTLCRAASIPARVITGIPVLGILQEEGGQLRYGHAWVEIKLDSYGWIPLDITNNKSFMSNNHMLNLKTYEGIYNIEGNSPGSASNTVPIGFTYFWDGGARPDIFSEVIYRVSGLDIKDINMMLEREFIDNTYKLLNEYTAAINHVNEAHGKSWIYNDVQHIAIEETLQLRFMEIINSFENINYPPQLKNRRNNILAIMQEISLYKNMQITSAKNNNYEQFIDNYNKFALSLEKLFNDYNRLVSEYNKKYN